MTNNSGSMLFERYRISEKTSAEHFTHACFLGMVSLLFALLTLLSVRTADRVPSWAALGITSGLLLLLTGAYRIHRIKPATRWGRQLMNNTDRWFPVFLFFIRKFFMVAFSTLLWITLQQLGLPSSLPINILFACLMLLIPLKGLLRECVHRDRLLRLEILNEFALFVLISAFVLLVVLILTALPPTPFVGASVNMLHFLLWIIAILIITTCLILFLSHLPRHRPHPERPRKQPQKFFKPGEIKPEY